MTRHEPNFTDRTSPAALSILTGAMLRLSAIFPSCKCGDEEEMETDDAGEEGGEESGDPPPSICFNPCPGNVGRDYCECTVLNGLGQDTHLYHYGTLCYDSEYNDNSASLQAACLEENWKINPEADPPIRIDDVWDCTYRGPCPPESEPAPTTGEPAGCSGWDPAGDINFVGGVYGVDALLLSSVVNDPTILGKCEEFGTSMLTSGGVQLNDLNPGELLHELGLRNGDIPLELNGMPLDTFEDGVEAYWELYHVQGDDEYELELVRGGSPVTLNYALLFTL